MYCIFICGHTIEIQEDGFQDESDAVRFAPLHQFYAICFSSTHRKKDITPRQFIDAVIEASGCHSAMETARGRQEG